MYIGRISSKGGRYTSNAASIAARTGPALKKKSKRLCKSGCLPLAVMGTAIKKTKLNKTAW